MTQAPPIPLFTLEELLVTHRFPPGTPGVRSCLDFEPLSVAEVVLNRARSGSFPASLCGVVKQRGQFSFVRGGRLPAVRRDSAAWRKAVAVAHITRAELAEGAAPKALFFHARRVAPGWSRATRVATIGNHVFYR